MPGAKERQEPPEAGSGKNGFSPRASGGSAAGGDFISDLRPPEARARDEFLLF